MIWLFPPFPTLSSESSTGDTQEIEKERQIADGIGRERTGNGVGTKSYDGKKAWSSINHSIFYAATPYENCKIKDVISKHSGSSELEKPYCRMKIELE
jgi:hypothetical protein